MRKTLSISSLPRAAAGVLALLLLPAPALANQCVYSDGKNDNGPCVEVRNELSWFHTMNLWCHNGPTTRNHKIILRGNPDSFTCRGVSGRGTKITIQRVQIGCDTCDLTYSCEGKLVVALIDRDTGPQRLDVGNCVVVD